MTEFSKRGLFTDIRFRGYFLENASLDRRYGARMREGVTTSGIIGTYLRLVVTPLEM